MNRHQSVPEETEVTHNSLRILVVEDDPTTVLLLTKLIEAEGHTVCGVAAGSAEALQAMGSLAPDIVFMDLHLKDGGNGLDLTRHITQEFKIPVIIISGSFEEEVLAGVSASGALSFIEKPLRAVALRMNLQIAMHRHALQKRLAKSEQRYRNIFNNAPVGIYISHPEGRYLACNQAFASLLGYASSQELLTMLVSQDEQMYDMSGRRQELLQLLREQGEVCNFESKVFGRDGDLLWISEYCTPVFDKNKNLLHYEGIVIDSTSRKMAEDAFKTAYNLIRTTIDSLQDGVIVTDLQGNLVIANRTAMGMAKCYLGEGEIPPFLDMNDETSPFARFVKGFVPQEGQVCVCPGRPVVPCDIMPYRNADNIVIGAVHVLRSSMKQNDTTQQRAKRLVDGRGNTHEKTSVC